MKLLSVLQKFKTIIILSALTVIFLVSSRTLFNGSFFTFHDFTQGARIVEMATALRDGHFPVIWSQNLGYGYGMPLFEFYAPLPYYIVSAFYLLGGSLINAIKLLFIIPTVITIYGAYLLGKKLYGSLGGVLVSAAFTLSPYRAVNLFVRGALSEIWGIMFLPIIVLGLIKTIKEEKFGWVLLVASITGLLISHNLTALMFLPFSLVFGAIYLLYEKKTKKLNQTKFLYKIFQLAGYYFLSFTLSSFYTIPAFIEKGFTRLETTILGDYFDYNLHFVYLRQFFTDIWKYGGSTFGPEDGISFFLGWGQLIGLVVSLFLIFQFVLIVMKSKRKQQFLVHLLHSKTAVIYSTSLFLFFIALLLTTHKTKFVWDFIPSLSFLQFPWRFLAVATFFLSLSIGAVASKISIGIKTIFVAPFVFLSRLSFKYFFRYFVSALLLITIFVTTTQYFRPEKMLSLEELSDYYYSDAIKLRKQMSTTLPDYIPLSISQDEIKPVALPGQLLQCQVLENCTFAVDVKENKVHRKTIKANLNEESLVAFTIANYPRWSVTSNGNKIETSTSKEGFLQATIPAGEQTIAVSLVNTQTRKNANILSMLSLGVFTILVFTHLRKNQK